MNRSVVLIGLCLLPTYGLAQDSVREELEVLRTLVEEQQSQITQLNDIVNQQQLRMDTLRQDVSDFERGRSQRRL